MENLLYYGDNLKIIRKDIPDNSVDLIYLDPPFNSNKNYNQIFTSGGKKSEAQLMVFEDTWFWGPDVEKLYFETIKYCGNDQVCRFLIAMRELLGANNLMAYLTMMAIRLVELHRVLKSTGTIYLHCDPKASHYLKLLMDCIFGVRNYRNEIVWCYAGGGIPKKDFPRKHDIIFRYSKSNGYYYQPVFKNYSEGTIRRGRTKVKGVYAERGLRPEGTPVNDWWTDIAKITSPTDPEKIGYPTQKPRVLLERIINVSSKEGNLILDPFCGCGTAIVAAEKLNRRWIGIDITHIAITTIKDRLKREFGLELRPNKILGEPYDLDGALDLACRDRYQFQIWALSSLLGIRNTMRKGADGGIDGIYYFEDGIGQMKKCIAQVKSGRVSVREVRELNGVLQREKAEVGLLVTLQPPTKNMNQEAASSGIYESSNGRQYPVIQIVEISEILNHSKFLHTLLPG